MRLDRADNVPNLLLPLIFLFWIIWAAVLIVAHAGLHLTCRIERKTPTGPARPLSPAIYCCWHDSLIGYLVGHRQFDEQMVIIINFDWYMQPVHWFARCMRVTHIIKFFPRESNKQVAADAIAYLQKGSSQLHLPDGPRGPLRVMKKGVLHIAATSGVPVVPVRITCSHSFQFPWAWDKKRVPLPFSKLTLEYAEPVHVSPHNFDEAERRIFSGLG